MKQSTNILSLPLQEGTVKNDSPALLRLAFLSFGFSAISCIALHVTGIINLQASALFLVLPAAIAAIIFGIKFPRVGKLVLRGWAAGVLAVACYDLARIPFMMAGWADFIPSIGDWLLGTENVHGAVGYSWRYIGNGGGLGIAFVMLMSFVQPKKNLIAIGTLFGFLVFVCLDITLIAAPTGQDMMFEITALTTAGSLVGHLVYGTVLGIVIHRLVKKEKVNFNGK